MIVSRSRTLHPRIYRDRRYQNGKIRQRVVHAERQVVEPPSCNGLERGRQMGRRRTSEIEIYRWEWTNRRWPAPAIIPRPLESALAGDAEPPSGGGIASYGTCSRKDSGGENSTARIKPRPSGSPSHTKAKAVGRRGDDAEPSFSNIFQPDFRTPTISRPSAPTSGTPIGAGRMCCTLMRSAHCWPQSVIRKLPRRRFRSRHGPICCSRSRRWRCAMQSNRARARRPSRTGSTIFSMAAEKPKRVQSLARCRWRTAAEADARPHLAGADRFWLHRSAACAPVPQADSDAARGRRIRLRLSVSLETFVGNLLQPAWLRAKYPARDARSASARYDRHTVFHLGARLGRISCLVAVTKIPPHARTPSARTRARAPRCGRRRFRKANAWFRKGTAEIYSSHPRGRDRG